MGGPGARQRRARTMVHAEDCNHQPDHLPVTHVGGSAVLGDVGRLFGGEARLGAPGRRRLCVWAPRRAVLLCRGRHGLAAPRVRNRPTPLFGPRRERGKTLICRMLQGDGRYGHSQPRPVRILAVHTAMGSLFDSHGDVLVTKVRTGGVGPTAAAYRPASISAVRTHPTPVPEKFGPHRSTRPTHWST